MVPADSRRVPRAPRYLGTTGKQDRIFTYRAVTFSGRPFQTVRLTPSCPSLHHLSPPPLPEPTTPGNVCGPATPRSPFGIARFRLLRFRSPLLSESRLFSSPPGTEMVHFPGFASPPYGFRRRFPMFASGGFPHSDISGSQPVSGSPKLFAAGHVLLRLFAPRHPHARS